MNRTTPSDSAYALAYALVTFVMEGLQGETAGFRSGANSRNITPD